MNIDRELAGRIDHTLLKPLATLVEYERLVEQAIQYGFASVCVPPSVIPIISEICKERSLVIATVIGFPMGYTLTETKCNEIESCIELGASELDIVINLSQLKSGDWKSIDREIESLRKACGTHVMKLIIETALLTPDEIKRACELSAAHKVDYVKTSSGFNGGGASMEAVELMRAELPKEVKIKASGGIKNNKFAKELILAGADRLGCSASIAIVSL